MNEVSQTVTESIHEKIRVVEKEGTEKIESAPSISASVEKTTRKKKPATEHSKRKQEKSIEQRLMKKVEKLSKQVDSLNLEKSKADVNLKNLTSERNNLLREMKAMSSKNEALERNATKHHKVIKQLDDMKAAKLEVTTERDALMKKVEELSKSIVNPKFATKSSNSVVDDELQNKKSQVDEHHKCAVDLNADMTSQLQISERNKKLKQQVDDLLKGKKEIEEMLKKRSDECESIKSKFDGVTLERDEMADLLKNSEELIKEVNNLTDYKQQADEVIENMKLECESLRVKVTDLTSKEETQRESIKNELAKEVEKNKSLAKKNAKLKKEVGELEDAADITRKENEEVLQSIDATFQRRLDALGVKSNGSALQINNLKIEHGQMEKQISDLTEEKKSLLDELTQVTNERDFFSRTISQLTLELNTTTSEFSQMKSIILQMQKTWTPPNNKGKVNIMRWISRRNKKMQTVETLEENQTTHSRGQWPCSSDDDCDDDRSYVDVDFPSKDTDSTADAALSSTTKETIHDDAFENGRVVPKFNESLPATDPKDDNCETNLPVLYCGRDDITNEQREQYGKVKESDQKKSVETLNKQSSARKELDRNQFHYLMFT